MNKLAVTLFVNKYFDFVFLSVALVFVLAVILFQKFWNKSTIYKSLVKKTKENKKKVRVLALIVIFLIGFLLRLYNISSPLADWHSFRQADTSSVTKIYIEEGIDLLRPKYHDLSSTQSGLFNPQGYRFVEFPIFNLIHVFIAKSLPILSIEEAGRLVSIISSLIAGIFIYLLGRKAIGEWGGIISAGFYLLLPFNIYFTRVILPEPLAVALGLIAVYLFWNNVERERFALFFGSSVFFSLALLVKPYTIFFAVPMIVIAKEKYGLKRLITRKDLYFFAIVSLLPLIVWRGWMQNFPEGIPFWKWTFNGDGIRFRPAFWNWIFGERLGRLILGVWGVIPFYYGTVITRKHKLVQGFLLGMLLYVSIIATANVRHDYYQTITIPAVSLALASGLLYLWKLETRHKKVLRWTLSLIVLLMFLVGAFQVKEFYKINRPEIVAAGERVDDILPESAIVIAPYNGDTAFLYQTGRRGWPVVDRPIDELIERGVEYYVSVDLSHPQTIEFSKKYEVIERTDQFVIIKLK